MFKFCFDIPADFSKNPLSWIMQSESCLLFLVLISLSKETRPCSSSCPRRVLRREGFSEWRYFPCEVHGHRVTTYLLPYSGATTPVNVMTACYCTNPSSTKAHMSNLPTSLTLEIHIGAHPLAMHSK